MSFGFLAYAQQARVIKVKGQQAIVQFPQGTTPLVGEALNVGGASAPAEGGGAGIPRGSRDQTLGLSTNLGLFTVSDGGGSATLFNFAGRYGWNMQIFEFGPIATITYTSSNLITNRYVAAGGFFDFNFIPNVIGQQFVYGVGAEGTFGQATGTIASVDTTNSLTSFLIGGQAKWFGLSDHFALRGDAGLNIVRTSASIGNVTTGLLIRGGVTGYF